MTIYIYLFGPHNVFVYFWVVAQYFYGILSLLTAPHYFARWHVMHVCIDCKTTTRVVAENSFTCKRQHAEIKEFQNSCSWHSRNLESVSVTLFQSFWPQRCKWEDFSLCVYNYIESVCGKCKTEGLPLAKSQTIKGREKGTKKKRQVQRSKCVHLNCNWWLLRHKYQSVPRACWYQAP